MPIGGVPIICDPESTRTQGGDGSSARKSEAALRDNQKSPATQLREIFDLFLSFILGAPGLPQVAETNTPLPMDAAGEDLLYDKFMLGLRKVGETSMRRHFCIAAILALISVFLTLVACGVMLPTDTPAPGVVLLLPVETSNQANLQAARTQEQSNADNQAVATAEIMRTDAQATLSSANATLSAAQTQDQNNSNIIAAQIAATAEFNRAIAQATLVAANSTQSAALTQDALRQTQTQYDLQVTQAAGTQSAEAMLIQQNKNDLAASTQTAVANAIATQTQAAEATSQWYADQDRQRAEQRQVPLTFLWVWCLPIFFVVLAGLVVWGFWRWLKIRQSNQRILENPVGKLPAPGVEVIDLQQDDSSQYFEGDGVEKRYRLTKPSDQVRRWLEDVKRKLLSSDKKDEDDNPDN